MPNGRWSGSAAWSLIAAATHPFAVLGLVLVAVHFDAARAPVYLVVLLWTAVVLVGALSFVLPVPVKRNPDALLLSAVCLFWAAVLTGQVATSVIIDARGSRTTCEIVAVERRVTLIGTTGLGTPTGAVDHEHDLRCDSGPITAVDHHRRAGEPGQRLEIAWDPEGVYEPRPVADLHGPWYLSCWGWAWCSRAWRPIWSEP